jgi:hypothetical protein
VQSSLVLIDVFSQDRKSGLPVRDFQKKGFRLLDNQHEVRITTFDVGAQYDTRPITLWLVMICNESGLPKFGASAEFLGQESLFRPALNHLETHDSVGVAHWCDNGDAQLDLLPTEDRDKAIGELAETLKPIPFAGGTFASDEAGEQAWKRLWRNHGRQQLESFRLAPWTSRRRRDLLELLDRVNPMIAELTQAIEKEADKRLEAQRLMTHPGVGALTALAFLLITTAGAGRPNGSAGSGTCELWSNQVETVSLVRCLRNRRKHGYTK